jgi:5-oxoprolinase (ATP-hydrolysing)
VESVGGGSDAAEPEQALTAAAASHGADQNLCRRRVARHPALPATATADPGMTVMGPALIIEAHNQTTVVEPGWQASISALDHMVLTRAVAAKREFAIGTSADPVMLEVFNNLFMSIAEQMGVTLQNTAYSVNIKERLDFSCAVFDADRKAGRQRAAHAGASGLDGQVGGDHHRQQPGDAPRRRLR